MHTSRLLLYVGIVLLGLVHFTSIDAQVLRIRVLDIETGEGLPEVAVIGPTDTLLGYTGGDGFFEANIDLSWKWLRFEKKGYESNRTLLDSYRQKALQEMVVYLIPAVEVSNTADEVTIVEADIEDAQEDLSTLLQASRDFFISTAAYNWGPLRFRIRGYNSEETPVYINDVEMMDFERRRIYWGLWGGLNEVTRRRYTVVGLTASDLFFGGAGGGVWMDMSPDAHRAGLRLSTSVSNRSYRYRLMASYTDEWKDIPLRYTVSSSVRWAEEGYIPGTFYKAFAYYLGMRYRPNRYHQWDALLFGAPIRRGRATAATMEMYRIAGSHYYNPNWGYQDGRKRNARVAFANIPVFILRHSWYASEDFTLWSSFSIQGGANGSTALNWAEANDPRADYYQKWPSYFTDSTVKHQLAEWLHADERNRQIQWEYLYLTNLNNFTSIDKVNGTDDGISGLQSLYIVEQRRYDYRSLQWTSKAFWRPAERLTVVSGVQALLFKKYQYKIVDDLLGGDFWLDYNKYETDFVKQQYNLDRPNSIARVGDTIGYNYRALIQRYRLWSMLFYQLPQLDFHLGFQIGWTGYRRKGLWRNGFFPDRSKGYSELKVFLPYTLKTQLTFKASGRQYVLFQAMYQTRPPAFSNAMISPRTRNDFIPKLEMESLIALEGSWVYRAPSLKARITGFYTLIKNGIRHRSAFFDSDNARGLDEGEFGNIILSGIDRLHRGVELSAEIQLGYGFSMGLAATKGAYRYASNVKFLIFPDDSDQPLPLDSFVYVRNFRLPGLPEEAYALELRYNGRRYWWLSLKANYLGERYLDFYPYRRTRDFTRGLVREDPLFEKIVAQERVPGAFTLDLFGGKSFRWGPYYLLLTVNASNLLNNTDIITGGFEQYRVRNYPNGYPNLNIFPNKYFFAYGRTYFVNVSLRF